MSRMSSSTVPLVTRTSMISGAFFGVLMYSWALFTEGALRTNMKYVLSLFGAIVVVLALVYVSLRLLAALKRSFDEHGMQVKQYLVRIVLALAAIVFTFVAVAAVMDWGVGVGIRQMEAMSFLPAGNLVEAAGPVGWTYNLLIAMGVVGVLWGMIPSMFMKLVASSKTSSKPIQLRPRAQEDIVVKETLRPHPAGMTSRMGPLGKLFEERE